MWIFLNIHNNECFYTDTDSFTLVNVVVHINVGKDTGVMELEQNIHKGNISKKKNFYAIENTEGKWIVKESGVIVVILQGKIL